MSTTLFNSFRIVVQPHAVYQFVLRFFPDAPTSQADLKSLEYDIAREVRDGLTSGRVSPRKPASLHPPDDPDCLYVWTPDEKRIYAIKHSETPPLFAVMTTMKANREPVAA